MPLESSDLHCARKILAGAVLDPFYTWPTASEVKSETLNEAQSAPINRWMIFLSRELPLWTFQTKTFLPIGEPRVVRLDPLRRMIESVLADEAYDRDGFLVGSEPSHELTRNLYARREELGRGELKLFGSCFAEQDADSSWGLMSEHPRSLRRLAKPPDIVYRDPDGGGGICTIYEEIGRELALLIRALNTADTAAARSSSQDEIDAFLEDLAAKLPAHRPSSDPPSDVLADIFAQGRKLVEILWTPLDSVPGNRTSEILADADAREKTHGDWALRLAVPALSWPELQGLRSEFEEDRTWSKPAGLKKPTPRRFTIWLLAHRFGSPPERLANKLGSGSDWDYFKTASNPIEAFV